MAVVRYTKKQPEDALALTSIEFAQCSLVSSVDILELERLSGFETVPVGLLLCKDPPRLDFSRGGTSCTQPRALTPPVRLHPVSRKVRTADAFGNSAPHQPDEVLNFNLNYLNNHIFNLNNFV